MWNRLLLWIVFFFRCLLGIFLILLGIIIEFFLFKVLLGIIWVVVIIGDKEKVKVIKVFNLGWYWNLFIILFF